MKLYKALSSRHGFGLFTDQFIPEHSFICHVIDRSDHRNCHVNNIGKLINHSILPNTYLMTKDNKRFYLISAKDIYRGTEITANYFNTPDCIMKPDMDYANST